MFVSFFKEFDKQAAKTVQSFFEEIDSVLFEQNLNGPQYIRKECQEWQFQFPHLRYVFILVFTCTMLDGS